MFVRSVPGGLSKSESTMGFFLKNSSTASTSKSCRFVVFLNLIDNFILLTIKKRNKRVRIQQTIDFNSNSTDFNSLKFEISADMQQTLEAEGKGDESWWALCACSSLLRVKSSLSYISNYLTYTCTHTHIYIYIYIYIGGKVAQLREILCAWS